MSATTTERTDTLTELLREYGGKITDLNREMISLVETGWRAELLSRYAWIFDRVKRLDQPIRELVNLAASHLEHGDSDSVGGLELTLRLGEVEAQLHHMLRQAGELQKSIDGLQVSERIARLRESAGLNAMKGGPLRPTA